MCLEHCLCNVDWMPEDGHAIYPTLDNSYLARNDSPGNIIYSHCVLCIVREWGLGMRLGVSERMNAIDSCSHQVSVLV